MNETFTFTEIDLPAAIRGLREALGRTPEIMAKILGCSLPAYLKWEAGALNPGGEWLIRMLQICPNEETRNSFRIRAERRAAARPKLGTSLSETHPLSSGERQHYQRMAHEAVDAIAECGRAGAEDADRRLRQLTENMQDAAHYYLGRASKRTD